MRVDLFRVESCSVVTRAAILPVVKIVVGDGEGDSDAGTVDAGAY